MWLTILKKDPWWCKTMGYRNPYLDNYNHHLTARLVTTDPSAYRAYPALRHVYDKLWIAKTQGVLAGPLEDVRENADKMPYPIFIKPRYGHLSMCSRNCHRIDGPKQLLSFTDYPHMMWSEYIDATEGMTDFILLDGKIVDQLTYVYSDEQRGNVEIWKFISSKTPAPPSIRAWVIENIGNHTGFVNVQYRGAKIIEVGLRPARGGGYLIIGDNPGISSNIRNLLHEASWDHQVDTSVRPFYSFKCFTSMPILTIWPEVMYDWVCSFVPGMLLHEYYIEPVNGKGTVFAHIAHRDKEAGDSARRIIDALFCATQVLVICLICLIPVVVMTQNAKIAGCYITLVILLLAMRFFNPLLVQVQLWMGHSEALLGKKSIETPEQFDAGTLLIQQKKDRDGGMQAAVASALQRPQ